MSETSAATARTSVADPTTMPSSVDLLVIGGGVIGLAIGYEASRAGQRVLVVERDRPGAGATGAAAGMLAPASEAGAAEPCLVELALESCRLYPEFVRAVEADSGVSCRYRTEGTLLVALNRNHEEELQRQVDHQRALGLRVSRLTASEVLDREPALSPRAISGIFAEEDRQVDPRALVTALTTAIRRVGGSVRSGAPVESVWLEDGRVAGVRLADGEDRVRSGSVVVAAGAWSNGPMQGIGEHLPLRPVKGQAVRLRGEPLLRHVVRTPDVYLVPREDGELLVGGTMEEQGFDGRSTAGATMDLLREAWRVLPGVYDLELAELSAGFRPALRDNLPAIGPMGPNGLFLATGHYRHGILLAPATARLLVEAIRTGFTPPELAPFAPVRLGAIAGLLKGDAS